MGIIRELPTSVVNQIAAGEVVERPSSVVKELLENAIDAGAGRVEVAVERGGKDLVRVADDGQGMDRDDLLLAFRPHATSKLTEAEDLFRIRTLGFRGEALAAIAEVSRLRCQTRRAEAPAGSEILIEGGEASPIRDCGCPPGTVMEVRNLFYNVPVRRSFLKSDQTEAGHVAETFMRVALAHPTVHMTYRSAGKVVYDLPATTGVKHRISAFFGQELADSLIWIESRIESAHLWGYVAHPSQSRPNAKGQFFFVGGRFVRDRSLAHALSESYRGLLMVGRLPVAFLYLDLPPDEVDVNIHPTKIEVRFRDGHRVYSQLLAAVRQTFLQTDLHTRLQFPIGEEDPASTRSGPASEPSGSGAFALAGPSPDRQEVAGWFTTTADRSKTPPSSGVIGRPAPPDWSDRLPLIRPDAADQTFDEFRAPGPAPSPEIPAAALGTGEGATAPPPMPPAEGEAAPMPETETAGPPLKALQIHDSYLIAETADGLAVVDQHALHERILFEELRHRIERGGLESQRLLVPVPVDLSPAEAAEIRDRAELLARLGFEIEPFGGDTVLISSVPVLLRNVTPEALLRDLAEHFRTEPLPPTADALLQDVLSLVACKAAIKAGQPLAPEEISALLARRHLANNTHHCPHGRPTILTFSKAELERQFGRT